MHCKERFLNKALHILAYREHTKKFPDKQGTQQYVRTACDTVSGNMRTSLMDALLSAAIFPSDQC